MRRIRDWTRRHQVVSFVVLTFAFLIVVPVLGFFVWPRFFPMNRLVGLYVTRLAIYGPALAGLVVTGLVSGGERKGRRSSRALAFAVTWVVAALAGTIYHFRLEPLGETVVANFFRVAPIAVLPALVVSGAFSRRASVRAYLSSLVRPRDGAVWYLVALLTFPLIHLIGTAIAQLFGLESGGGVGAITGGMLLAAGLTFLRVFFFTGGINEESGWRGFMLPRLQARFSPLVAGLVIWAVHMTWELPGDLLTPGASWPWLSRLVLMPCWSLLFIWIHNRTKGSILAPALFHSSMNSMNPLMEALPVSSPVIGLLVAVAAGAVLWDRMWRALPADHPAVVSPAAPLDDRPGPL